MEKGHKTPTEKWAIGIIVAICLFAILGAVITRPKNTTSTVNLLTPEQIQNCENTPQKQLYQQLLAQEQAAPAGLSGSLVSTLATLAPQVQQQQLRCEEGLPAN